MASLHATATTSTAASSAANGAMDDAASSPEITATAAAPSCRWLDSANYKDVVIVGNGPSAISLSYLLHGYRGYYNGNSHSNTFLTTKLQDSKASIIEQDLEYLSEGLEGRSPNPVALLWDALTHPDADMGAENPSLLSWAHEQDKVMSHVVLGKMKAGGSWQRMEGAMQTLSQNAWMELPDRPFRQWLAKRHRRPDFSSNRATTGDVRDYYVEYVNTKGLSEHFRDFHTVTSVQKVYHTNSGTDCESGEVEPCCSNVCENHHFLWEVRGYRTVVHLTSTANGKGSGSGILEECKELLSDDSASENSDGSFGVEIREFSGENSGSEDGEEINSKDREATISRDRVSVEGDAGRKQNRCSSLNGSIGSSDGFSDTSESDSKNCEDEAVITSLINSISIEENTDLSRKSRSASFSSPKSCTEIIDLEKRNRSASFDDSGSKNSKTLAVAMGDKSLVDREEFCFMTPNVVLATGTYDIPNRLGVIGENSPSVVHSLCALEERLLVDDDLSRQAPLCVVGAGLSAADAILMALEAGLPVIHVFRCGPSDPNLIFRRLPQSIYPEYHRVAMLMKGEVTDELYQPYPRHRVVEIGQQMVFLAPCKSSSRGSTPIHHPHSSSSSSPDPDASIVSLDVSLTVVMIGSRPDLSFLPSGGRELGVVPKWPIDSKHNPIDVDPFSYESTHEKGLFAMGPLIGDNFVRFGIGGSLGIMNHLCSQ